MLKSALVWTTPTGRELLRLVEGSDEAYIVPMTLKEADLRELAKACGEAAEQIAGFKADAAPRKQR